MRRPALHRGTAGFTLVEVLVALVVMTTMAAMAWRGIDALVRSRETAQGHLAQTARLQTVMAQWEVDLRALQDSHSPVQPLAFDGGNLVLTRQGNGGLQVVVWSLREGSLWRWESPGVRTVQELDTERQRGMQQLASRNPALRCKVRPMAVWLLMPTKSSSKMSSNVTLSRDANACLSGTHKIRRSSSYCSVSSSALAGAPV